MDNKKLPTNSISGPVSVKKLSFSVMVVLISFLGVYLTAFDIPFIILGVLGVVMFIAGNLLNKSLSLTQNNLAHPDPFTVALRSLLHEISQTKYMVKVNVLGERAWTQAKTLESRWPLLQSALKKKFNPTELAYTRYMSAVRDTAELILGNLKLLTSTLNSMEVMDPKSPEFETQKASCLELLSMNDSALTQLMDVETNVNQIDTSSSKDSLESNLEELKRLAAQAKKYSK